MKRFIAIAGNMGIGKTRLTKQLAEYYNWQKYLEPFEDNPYLENFYQDMKSWAFHSQLYFLGKRLQDHHTLVKASETVIQDRSLYENAEVFAKNLYKQGYISAHDWQTYEQLYKSMCQILPPPDLVIYLKASTYKIYQRIQKRNRKMEEQISWQYIDNLNQLYEEWISSFKLTKVLTLPYDKIDLKYSKKDWQWFLDLLEKNL